MPISCEAEVTSDCRMSFSVVNGLHILEISGIADGFTDVYYVVRALSVLIQVLPIERFIIGNQNMKYDFYCTRSSNWPKRKCQKTVCCGFDISFEITISSQHPMSDFGSIKKIQDIVWSYTERNFVTGNVVTSRFESDRQSTFGVPLYKTHIDINAEFLYDMRNRVNSDRLNMSILPEELDIAGVVSFDDKNTLRQLNVTNVIRKNKHVSNDTAGIQHTGNIIILLICVTVIKICNFVA